VIIAGGKTSLNEKKVAALKDFLSKGKSLVNLVNRVWKAH
jgi:hypothetical protein